LALVVVVDGLGSDLLLRNRPRLSRGLAALTGGGAFYPYARYGFAEPSTAPGHTTLVTGADPWRHGVVSNRVMDRAAGRMQGIFADPAHPVLEAPLAPADDVSPERLLAETVGDRVRLTSGGRGKVVALSGKARSAIPLAGRGGQAWWFHEGTGRFVTGTWYAKEAPAWVRAFNEGRPADRAHGERWTLALPFERYAGQDDRPFEEDFQGMGRTFPHPLTGGADRPGPASYAALAASPLLDALVVDLALQALQGEGLGRDEVPDLLAVSLSALDPVVHHHGPSSLEAQDALVRLDAQLARLLEAAARAAGGRDGLLVVLTGDHGGAPLPEEWAAAGMDAGRVNPNTLARGLERELAQRFGAEVRAVVDETDVYLTGPLLEARRADLPAVRRAAAQWLQAQPGILTSLPREDLFAPGQPDPHGVLAALRRGYFPERSGDVLLVARPFHPVLSSAGGTTHGMPWAYDSQVPLVLHGRGVRPGLYRQEVAVTDVAPTLAALLEVGMPASSEGAVRVEALAPPPPERSRR
jgi:predicted AlkP superfamily pyrophosphatase or phosphodiesterase